MIATNRIGCRNAEGNGIAAAVGWANTPNGKLARELDQASEQTIPAIASCPKDHGWHSEKADGRRWCYGFSKNGKMTSGWALP